MKTGGNSDQLETRASAPAAKRASEHSIAKPTITDAPINGPQLHDPKRYHVMGEHGRGGLGRVSRAHDRELGRDVAIKELISRNDVHEARFLREALITARLEHPGIVPVHEAGRWPDGTPYYAMKLVSGRSLRDLIAECATSDQRIGLLHHVIAVADAIAYAHGCNIIHRDLKPANVIVGEFGETIVIDWGLAKDLTASEEPALPGDHPPSSSPVDEELTVEGSVLGTPAYMAPEQGRGESVDQRADVFAIGTMLWELCAARRMPPANPEARHRLLRRAGIDQDLITIIDNALDPDPEKRYPDAGALAADLKAFKSGARIAARDYSLWAMLAHWTRRHRALALSVTTALVVVVAGVVGFVRNIATERDRADSALVTAQRERDRSKLSEASLVIDRDPNRALSLLGSFAKRTPQVALLTSRARHRAATQIVATTANIRGLFRAPDEPTVELVTLGGELYRFDPRDGGLATLDRDVMEALAYRAGQPLYVRRPAGASHVRIATPSNINAMEASGLHDAIRMVTLRDTTTYVIDEAGDLHLLDGKTARVIDHDIHRIAGDADTLLVCRRNGTLDIERNGVVVSHGRCSQSKTLAALAVVGNDYAVFAGEGTLVASRGGRPLELATEIRGEYELALSAHGAIAIADYAVGGKAWFVSPGGARLEPGPTQSSSPYSVAADGDIVAWGYEDGTVAVRDTVTGMSWELHGHVGPAGYLVVDAANARVISASDRELRVWDIKPPSSSTISAIPCSISHVEASPDGKQAAMDCNDGSIRVWTRATGAVAYVHTHLGPASSPQWFRGMICSGGDFDGFVRCSTPGGATTETLDTRSRINGLTVAPDHKTIFAATVDGGVWRFDRTLETLYSHGGPANRAVVSANGRMLASCAQDGSIAVYDLANKRLRAMTFAHIGAACSVSWVGEQLWSGGGEGTLKKWAVSEAGLTLLQVVQLPGPLRLLKVFGTSWAAVIGADVLAVSRDGSSIAMTVDVGGSIDALDAAADGSYAAVSLKGEVIVVDLQHDGIAALAIGAPVKQVNFLEGGLLTFSEPSALKTVWATQLEYLPFEPLPKRGVN